MRRWCVQFLCFGWLVTTASISVAESKSSVGWLDQSHQSILTRTQKTAQWFDHFFGDRRDKDEAAKMKTRITLGWEPNNSDWNDPYVRIRVKIELPQLERRFDLLLSNEEDDDYNLLPLESNRPEENDSSNDFNAALRWIQRFTPREAIDYRIGLRSGPNIYARGRHRRQHNLTEHIKLQLTATVFLDSKEGNGGRLLNELDYLVAEKGIIRFSTRGEYTSKSNGLEWRGGLSYTHRLAQQGAVVTGFYLSGETDSEDNVDTYSISSRWRNQFWQPYLFYEVEPFIDWSASDDYHSNSGAVLRLVMVIGD